MPTVHARGTANLLSLGTLIRPLHVSEKAVTLGYKVSYNIVIASICSNPYATGYRVVQVHVIFKFPDTAIAHLFPPHRRPPEHLAYVEWFSPFPRTLAPNHHLYKLTHSIRNGECLASILPVQSLRRSIHLIPEFGHSVPQDWTSDTVLEESPKFFMN